MKYKIIRKEQKDIVYNKYKKFFELKRNYKYGAIRQSSILHIWKSDVGDDLTDSQGNNFRFTQWFDDEEQCISYAECFHNKHFPKYSFEVIKAYETQ